MKTKSKKKNKQEEKKGVSFKALFLIALILVAAFFQLNLFSGAASLKFAQLSDVHLSDRSISTSYKLLSYSDELLKDAITQINGIEGLDFVFVSGDAVDTPSEKLIMRFLGAMDTLKYPWYMSFGNHDVGVGGPVTKKYYLTLLNEHNKNFTFTSSYYAFTPKKGFKVIALDPPIDNKITANGYISPEQLTWVSNQIKNTPKDDVIIIFMHHPIREPFSSFHHRVNNAAEVETVLKSFNRPIAIFSGHYHATKVIKDGKLLHVSTPALVTYPNAFRVVQVTNNPNKVTFKLDFYETGLAEVQRQAKGMTFSSKTYYGEECDRNATIEILK